MALRAPLEVPQFHRFEFGEEYDRARELSIILGLRPKADAYIMGDICDVFLSEYNSDFRQRQFSHIIDGIPSIEGMSLARALLANPQMTHFLLVEGITHLIKRRPVLDVSDLAFRMSIELYEDAASRWYDMCGEMWRTYDPDEDEGEPDEGKS